MFREFGRKVITPVKFHQIAIGKCIVHTEETTTGSPGILAITHIFFSGSSIHRRYIIRNQSFATGTKTTCMFTFLVITEHHFKIMLSQCLFIISEEIECIIRIILLRFGYRVRICPGKYLKELSVRTVFIK